MELEVEISSIQDASIRFFKIESITIKEEKLDISDIDEPEFLDPEMLTLKQNNMEKTERKKFECNQCQASFKFKNKFEIHMNTHTKQITFECDQCPAVFYRESTAQKHRKAHAEFKGTGVTCTTCNVWCKNLKSLQMHKRTHEVKHKCDMCPRTFQFLNNLLAHKAGSHNPDGLIKCPYCQHTSSSKKYLLQHINIHTREKKYQKKCTMCDEVFFCYTTLRKHTERVHQPRREFKCDLCSYVFDTSVSLKNHKYRHKIHIPLTRYPTCEVCGIRFLEKDHLVKHMSLSHN